MRNIALVLAAATAVAGMTGCVIREQTTVYDRRPMYGPQPVVVAEPVIVDYTAVPPPPVITEYVFINGGYYYYHSERQVFVRVMTPPPPTVRVISIHTWDEYPGYARIPHAPPPTVVGPTVVVAPPTIVEYTTVIAPPVITEYIFIDGGYYYYHPERHVYVHLVAPPPPSAHIITIKRWDEHPMYTKVTHVDVPPPHIVNPPAHINPPTVVTPPAHVVILNPVIVEASAVVAPKVIIGYIHINGAYYYYHPEKNVYVHITVLPRGASVSEIHAWNEHPMYEKVQHVNSPVGPRG